MDEWFREWLQQLPEELANQAVYDAIKIVLLLSAGWIGIQAAKLRRGPKSVTVPLNPIELSGKIGGISVVAGKLSVTGDSKLTVAGRVRTASRTQRLLDEGLELLSLLPRHL